MSTPDDPETDKSQSADSPTAPNSDWEFRLYSEPPFAAQGSTVDSATPEQAAPKEESGEAFGAGPSGLRPRPALRRIWVVAGPKGGVGKTLLATNAALYLATIGRRVVLVDADPEGATAHSFVGLSHPQGLPAYRPPRVAGGLPTSVAMEPTLAEGLDESGSGLGQASPEQDLQEPTADALTATPTRRQDDGASPGLGRARARLIETSVPGLSLLHAGLDEPLRDRRRPTTRHELDEVLASLDAEYIVVDAGTGTDAGLLELWNRADLSLFVTRPEPAAVEHTYRFVRAALMQDLVSTLPDDIDAAPLTKALRRLGPTPAPLDLWAYLEDNGDTQLAEHLRAFMQSFRFPFVVNQTRLRADLELGEGMRTAAWRRLGLDLRYVGYVDHDDTVSSCVRLRRPLLSESPGTKASKNIEKITRRLLSIDLGKGEPSRTRSVPPESHHDLLEVDRGATDEEVRRAFKRAKDVYASGSLCGSGLFEDEGLNVVRARLDEAHDVLLDPERRRPYELSVFPVEAGAVSDADQAAAVNEPCPAAPTIEADTEFTGALLRAVRESQGVTLRDVSQRTKVGATYLQAIESEDYALLPAPVYVRGFVSEFAKYMKLDPTQASRSYVRRLERYRQEHGEGAPGQMAS